MLQKRTFGLTLGDPAGIGPEIAVKAALDDQVWACAYPLLIGDRSVVARALEQSGLRAEIQVVQELEEINWKQGILPLVDVGAVDGYQIVMGEVQAVAGRASYLYVKRAVELALAGRIAGIVTAPLNKEALRMGSVPYIGHTEMLADLTGATNAMTMFVIENVKIFFLTRHVPLVQACSQIADPEQAFRGIIRSYRALQDIGYEQPKLAVAALNPHAGDGGLIGDEEIRSLRPAVERARAAGMDVVGPVPADAVFHFARKGRYDAVLSLYHDQGHIAAKMIDFEKTVSVTLGLPILRTSVDHGTAFDIAGKGIASPVSMIEAVKVAAQLSGRWKGPGRATNTNT
jgi:4-hydroxythreonine-4-phosphate dehydrogenase